MIILEGNNLGARQKDFNEKVNEALKTNVAFDTLIPEPENTEADVDILFKIYLAANHKNVDYILQIFKSNNSLYISRALQKCLWLGDNEFNVNFNVENLHENIFRYMSIKMKKKLLSSLSMFVVDEKRASSFHEYCMEIEFYNLALKFLLKTSISYKQEIIQQKSKAYSLICDNRDKYLVPFIGQSFVIAEAFLNTLQKPNLLVNDVLFLLRHLYSVSEVQYLDLIEKYTWIYYTYREPFRLGRRLSKNIMESHNDRLLKYPEIYLNILDKKIVSRKCRVNEAKKYAADLLPEDASDFWHYSYHEMYKYILDIIPATEKFSYIKQIFTEKYANEPFETCLDFYTCEVFNIMTSEEKEEWALRHVASGKELLGSGNDFMWYKFVNFNKSFEEIKKYIFITSDAYKRVEILRYLIDSAKSQEDLEILLDYYYNRHVNEIKNYKEQFLDYLIEKHKVLNFNENCWVPLEKIFYSLEVFNKLNYKNCDSDYKVIALIYYIVRKDKVLEVLNEYIDMDIISLNRLIELSSDLGPEREMIFKYFLQFYLSKVEALDKETLSHDNKEKILRYVNLTLDLLYSYEKKKDSIPELINAHIKLNWETVQEHSFLYEPEPKIDIVSVIKNDAIQVINEFPKIKTLLGGHNTNWLVWKLKIYFHYDIAPQYLQLVIECLTSDELPYSLIECIVYTIFNLADESFKVNFLEKHVPTSAKIDHANISQKTLDMQRAICTVACFSRPLLPMKSILPFITGDYLKYCLPIFNSYLVNLTVPQCITFIESLLDTPISVQKHGLRLAFVFFSTESLVVLIKGVWKKSKNVSLRKIIYKALYDKIVKEKGQTQLDLFEVLKAFTLDLHQDDDQEVFDLLTNHKMTYDLKGHYVVSAWEAVKKLPERSENFQRIANVVTAMEQWLHLVPEDVLIAITDEHISDMLDKKHILNTNLKSGQELVYDAKWKLTDRYLTYVYKDEQIKRNLEVIKHITKQVIEMWNEVRNEKYVMREFCSSFLIKDLENKSYDVHAVESYFNVNIINRTILQMLQKSLPKQETYLLIWQLRLSYIAREIIIAGKKEIINADNVSVVIQASIHKFADAFESLVKEYIQSGKYFASFHEQIISYVINKLTNINTRLDVSFRVNFNTSDLCVIMSTRLVEYKFPEIYMFILNILPLKYYFEERPNQQSLMLDYEKVFRVIKTLKNDEVQYFMYKKFVLEDFIFRKHILS